MNKLDELKKVINKISKRLCEDLKNKTNNETLIKMFDQCFLNTIDTTVKEFDETSFIITGDIPAMWLRDSVCQVLHYLPYMNEEPLLKEFIKGLLIRQFELISYDPYANAFMDKPGISEWFNDTTEMKPGVWERKYEVDSLCFPVELLNRYYEITKDESIFNDIIIKGLHTIVDTFTKETHHKEESKYTFIRYWWNKPTEVRQNPNRAPIGYTGMTWSGFRPSDDECMYNYLIPSNMFSVIILRKIISMNNIIKDNELLNNTKQLLSTIEEGIKNYGLYNHPECGLIYAYETDGLGNYNIMDDANMPSLLSLPFFDESYYKDDIYINTRSFALSKHNPYYFEGSLLHGIGSPHTKPNYVWPMSLCVRGLTSFDKEEQLDCLNQLISSTNNTLYMHESVDANDEANFSRKWFAWANSMFAMFIIKYFDLKK